MPPTPRLLSTATSRPRALPRPATTQKPDISEKSTLPLGTTAPGPTEVAQTPTPESFLTIIQDEPEMPVSRDPVGTLRCQRKRPHSQTQLLRRWLWVGPRPSRPLPRTLPEGTHPALASWTVLSTQAARWLSFPRRASWSRRGCW